MLMKLIRTHVYIKRARKILSDTEMDVVEQEIIEAPEAWPVIPGTGGARKATAARGSSGKSGGARVIYYYVTNDSLIYLLDIYAKSQQENITEASKKVFREFIKSLNGYP